MSQKWFNGLNLQQNQLENAVIQNLASDPSSGKAGQIYYNTTDNGYRYYNGTAWVSISADAIKSIVAGNGLTSSTSGNAVTLTLGTPSTSGAVSGNTLGDNSVTENSHTHQIRIPSASTTERGIIQLATDTEVATGTETTKAVTPKQLAAAKQDAINSAKVTIQTSDGLTGGSSTPATSFTLGLSNSGVTAGTYNNVTVDAKGRVTAGSSQEYATKTYVDTQDDKKLDKAGGIITGDLTIGGNVTVNGTTTTVNSNTLTVKDKLIEVAKDNTTTLTSPAGIIVPKYNGTDYGALVIDSDGNAKVGDVKLTADGDIDVNNSDLQTLATRTNLVDGNLVQYDGTKQTLVDSGKKIGDLALKTDIPTVPTNYVTTDTKQDITGEKAFKNTNGLSTNRIHNLSGNEVYDFDGTNVRLGSVSTPTHIRGSEAHPKYEMSSGTAGETVKKDIALVEDIKTTKVDNAVYADSAGKVANELEIIGVDYGGTSNALHYTGDAYQRLYFSKDDFTIVASDNVLIQAYLCPTGVTAGTYNTVTVDTRGRVTAASNENYPKKIVQSITGDGSKTSFDVAHTLGADVSVQVYLKNQTVGAYTADELVMVDTYTRNNTVTLLFATAPTTAQTFKVVIIG
jgi:phage-related tail fiber protein